MRRLTITNQVRRPGESVGAEVAGEGPVVGDGRVPRGVVGGAHLRHDSVSKRLTNYYLLIY